MRKIKFSYQTLMDILAMHLEAMKAIKPNEHVDVKPFVEDRNGNITVYVQQNHR